MHATVAQDAAVLKCSASQELRTLLFVPLGKVARPVSVFIYQEPAIFSHFHTCNKS